jgi:hypothetical protein
MKESLRTHLTLLAILREIVLSKQALLISRLNFYEN